MKSYYYVYKHGDNAPRVRHATLKIAQDEAERLAGKEPGKCFEILQCVGYSSTAKASTFWMDGEEPEAPRYRMLEEGETINNDDEFTVDGGMHWRRVIMGGGKFYAKERLPHRRPL